MLSLSDHCSGHFLASILHSNLLYFSVDKRQMACERMRPVFHDKCLRDKSCSMTEKVGHITRLALLFHFRRFLGPRENPTPSRCLGVFGLSLHTQERNLYDIFSQYGNIEDVQLVFDNYTGRSRGFGFVYFTHVADAKAAKADAHGMEIDGRPIRCDFSITERPHSPTPGIYMGRPSSCMNGK
ncbi:unnamed protein product [Schistosoma mattheei]|uniref:RRM domain-containing protein n=1 Tax=Schistosoma mattheei TaxID=31246 RepID=A0AA85AWY7_9TREM|nr:unnamed protein product [Schistosoma mattheei]